MSFQSINKESSGKNSGTQSPDTSHIFKSKAIYKDSVCVNIGSLSQKGKSTNEMELTSDESELKESEQLSIQARTNDQIIHENLEIAKALNRFNENGATMHKFSLWQKRHSPSVSSATSVNEPKTILPTMCPSLSDSTSPASLISDSDHRDSSLTSHDDDHIQDCQVVMKTPNRVHSNIKNCSKDDGCKSSPRTTCTTQQTTPSSDHYETPRKCIFIDRICHVGVMRFVNLTGQDNRIQNVTVEVALQPSARDDDLSDDDDDSYKVVSNITKPCRSDNIDDLCENMYRPKAPSPDTVTSEKVSSIVSTPVRDKKLRALKGANPSHSNKSTPILHRNSSQRGLAIPCSAFGRSASTSSKFKLPPLQSTSPGAPSTLPSSVERASREPIMKNIALTRTPPSTLKFPSKFLSASSNEKVVRNGMKIPPLTASLTLRPSSVTNSIAAIMTGNNSARKGMLDRTAQSRLGSTRRSEFSPSMKKSPLQGLLKPSTKKLFANSSDNEVSAGEDSIRGVSPTRRLGRMYRRKSASPLPMLAARAAKIHFGDSESENKDNGNSASVSRNSKVKAAITMKPKKTVEVSPGSKVIAGLAKNISMRQSLSDSAKLQVESEEAYNIRWRRGQLIGEGTFGKVYKGLNENTGELLAVKQLYLADTDESDVEDIQEEINVICNLSHPNIVNYLGTTITDRHLFILLEYVPGGSIAGMLSQFGAFSEDLIRRFSYQILLGLEYLHNKLIVHRDIKGSNILVTDGGVAKLSDFGCSKQLAGMRTMSVEGSAKVLKGSVPWMAPEVIKQCGYGRSSDIWSFGATVIEMGM